VDLSWSASANAALYDVKRASRADGPYTTIASAITATSFADTAVSNGVTYYYVVRAINPRGVSVNSAEVSATPTAATVAGRWVFYNHSSFDGNDAAANASDDAAIAPDKLALLPGQTASFANYTSYSRGLNGIMIDLANLPAGTLSASDFAFTMGNSADPASWASAPAPSSITVRRGAGVNGSDRVTLTWADNAIEKQWLQVRVLPTSNTGLVAADVFYFGNAIGESGNAANTYVNAIDELAARGNQTLLAGIGNAYDFNRDGRVNALDQLIARGNGAVGAASLTLLAAPAASGPMGGMLLQGAWAGLLPGGDETFANDLLVNPKSLLA
jgi:hypothetical protein